MVAWVAQVAMGAPEVDWEEVGTAAKAVATAARVAVGVETEDPVETAVETEAPEAAAMVAAVTAPQRSSRGSRPCDFGWSH